MSSPTPPAEWFRGAPLGLFIHFGPSSSFATKSDAEWISRLGAGDAEHAGARFRPDPRVTSTWIAAAQAAGASYLTVTMKHHDGFCLWNTRETRWGVGEEGDLLRPLARAAQDAGLRLFVYYSILDLHEPAFERGESAYSAFLNAQLRELLTAYGELAGVWFDWQVGDAFSDELLREAYRVIHALQPWALVGTNHQRELVPGEDFQIYEETFPPTGDAAPVPRQAAFKLGPSWFWCGRAEPAKGHRFAELKADALARGVSLLVNVAPRPDGVIPDSVIAALRAGSTADPRVRR